MTVYILEYTGWVIGDAEYVGVYLTQDMAEAARQAGAETRYIVTEVPLITPRLEDPNIGDSLDKNGDCIVCGR